MTDQEQTERDQQQDDKSGSTTPPGGKTHEATTPPGQGERDERAESEARDRLDQAGGGH